MKKKFLNNARAFLAELWSRENRLVESDDYWTNGDDDNYSESVERVVINSPTAHRACEMMSKFIRGSGLTNDVDFGDETLFDKVREISQDIAMQGGCWIHRSVRFDVDADKFVTDKIEVLNYHHMRKGKGDDDDNSGKIYVRDKSKDKFELTKDKAPWFYPFSDDQKVIKSQIEADAKDKNSETIAEKLSHYRGQVLYINTTPRFIYALSPFDSVFNDMDTEYRISLYSNKIVRSGFLGKKIILFKEQDPLSTSEDEFGEEFDANVRMKELITGWMGAENSDSVFVSSVDNVEDIKDFIHVIDIPTDFNEDMFIDTINRVRRNILGSASSLPEGLVFSNDGGLFSGSGEQILQLKMFYNEQTEDYRTIIERALYRLGFDTKIIELT